MITDMFKVLHRFIIVHIPKFHFLIFITAYRSNTIEQYAVMKGHVDNKYCNNSDSICTQNPYGDYPYSYFLGSYFKKYSPCDII